MTKYIKDKSGKFAGSIGDGNKDIPAPQDDVVTQAQKTTETDENYVPHVSDIFAAYVNKTREMGQESNSSRSSYEEKVDTSKYGTYEKPETRPSEWRAADNLTIRWESNPLGFETASVELDMPGLIKGRDNLRDLIMDDKASTAMNNLAAELRRIADEMDNRAFDIALEEDSRRNAEEEEDYDVDYFNSKVSTSLQDSDVDYFNSKASEINEDDEGYFIERTNEYLDEYEDYVPHESSTIDSDPFWDLTAKPPF